MIVLSSSHAGLVKPPETQFFLPLLNGNVAMIDVSDNIVWLIVDDPQIVIPS